MNININYLVFSVECYDIPPPPIPVYSVYTTEEKMKQNQGNNYI